MGGGARGLKIKFGVKFGQMVEYLLKKIDIYNSNIIYVSYLCILVKNIFSVQNLQNCPKCINLSYLILIYILLLISLNGLLIYN